MSKELDEAFNKFAVTLLSGPEELRPSMTKGVVEVRTWGFQPSRFLGRERPPEDDDPIYKSSCCLYPGIDTFVPQYPTTDLPDSIIVNGNTLSLVAATTGHFNDYQYGAWNGSFGPVVFIQGSAQLWIYQDSISSWLAACLISPSWLSNTSATIISEDFFPDTYAVNLGGGFTGTVTRDKTKSLCKWIGSATNGGTTVACLLKYNAKIYKWQLNGVTHTDPQNNPVGAYGGYTIT